MNLDLLIKLVKLANNNPNENEANLAARKVCKMIAESKYQFSKGETHDYVNAPRTQSQAWTGTSNPQSEVYDWLKDFIKNASNQSGGSWTGFREGSWDYGSAQEEFNRQREKERQEREKAWEKYKPTDAQKEFYGRKYDIPIYGPEPPKRPEQRERTCTECGKTVMTRRVTNVFKCDTCEWKLF